MEFFENEEFDLREQMKEKNKKKHLSKKKASTGKEFKTIKKPDKKFKKFKLNPRLMDYDSEEWYED